MATGRRMPQNIDTLDAVTPFLAQSNKTTIFGGNVEIDGNLKVNGALTPPIPTFYRHVIKGEGQAVGDYFYVIIISRNSLKVDSLTDLKTLLGNTFEYPVNGHEANNDIAYIYMDQTGVYNSENTKFSFKDYPIIWTDTVTAL